MLDLTSILNRMNAAETEIPFRVVKCTEDKMRNRNAENGFIYFTTDTQKIYWGQNSKYIPMSGSAGLYYGKREVPDDEKFSDQTLFTFVTDEIDGLSLPAANDLILNIPDGGFYKVLSANEYFIETERLAIAGGSGGGGGSGASGVTITIHGERAKAFSAQATELPISFTGNYGANDGNRISQVTFAKKGSEPFYIDSQERNFNEMQTIDLINFIHLFNSNKTTVTMVIYDIYGGQKSTDFSIQLISLALAKTRDNILVTRTQNYTYACKLSGATSGIKNKRIVYKLFNENNLHSAVLTKTQVLNNTDIDTISYAFNFSSLTHGTYVLTVQAFVEPTSTDVPIPSEILTHKLVYFKEVSQPILTIFIPDKTEQYTNIPVEYLLTTQEGSNKQYDLTLKLNGVEKIVLEITENVKGLYELYFEDSNVTYQAEFIVDELGKTYSTYIVISGYTGHLPTINPNSADLMLYLTPRNKTNNATTRGEWSDYNGKHTGILTGLHYGSINGWMTNSNNINYLKLSSGAQFKLPTFQPFKYDPTEFNASDSSMGYGITIELDFTISGVLNYNSELMKCVSNTKEGAKVVGFVVTGDKVSFYGGSTQLMSLNLVEGKRTKISFVIEPRSGISYPMIYGYVNGKLSGAVMYKNASFKATIDDPALFEANSADAQIDIYGIRFYSSALGDRMILNNYTATLDTLSERQNIFESNDVYDANNLIEYDKVIAEDYDLQIPYMVLTGGYATGYEDDKWCRVSSSDREARLPTGKKDYRMVDVKVHYPDNDYFKDYQDYEFVNTFASGKPMATAYEEKPNNGGAIMYAQGTSSMEYPVKNLRLRFNKVKTDPNPQKNFFTVRPDISPVEIICMKADYMESSGSHNTGAANLIDELYAKINIKTPGQEYFEDKDKGTIVTCIKGHPCLIFYSETGEAGTYKYIGKYNLNLDKATPEPFGFEHDEEFGYLKPGDEYYKIDYNDDDEYIDTKEGEELQEVTEGEMINAIHCFEFLDNAVEVCNFKNKAKQYIKDEETGELVPNPSGGYYTYEETWYETFKNKDNIDVPGWTLGFESRYPEDKVGYHDADMLYPLASWLNELNTLRSNGERDKANARFKNEYQCYLNKEFTLTYYLITEALLMADSRVKNMMIATWGKENYEMNKDIHAYYTNYVLNAKGDAYIPDEASEKVMTNNYIFYPIFYDMDTMLGLDNTGVYRFNYYDEDTNASIYNGDEVLWTFVRDALQDELIVWYTKLETGLLTAAKILPYFNENQANMANEAFYNSDAKYKYTEPARNGYHDDLNDKHIAAGVGPYLYAAQGDRSLMREWFLTNRIKFLRGKYNSSQFQSGDRIEYRWYYPQAGALGTEFSGHEATIAAVPPSSIFDLTSIRTGYAGVMVGANAAGTSVERFDGIQEKQINASEGQGANGTEAYIVGLSNLSDLGDLSNKYMQKFIIATEDVRLKHLTLGNSHKDYYNPYWSTVVNGKSPEIGIDDAIYLETFNLQNCSTYKGSLNFTNCAAIQEILLTGSGVISITLPVNGILHTLRLPASISKLEIDSHSSLTDAGFSMGGYDYHDTTHIGEEGGEYLDDFTNLLELKIVDTPINGYKIVKGANNLQSYYFANVNWIATSDDTQYCLRLKDGDINPKYENYYIYDKGEKQYELWGQDTYPLDGSLLYEKVEMLDNDNKIINIPVLDYLASRSTINNVAHSDALSGILTIDIDGASVNEYAIYTKYATLYPNLKIQYSNKVNVEGAQTIAFYGMEYSIDLDLTKITPYFEVKTEQNVKTLSELIDNPYFTAPHKGSTNTQNFTFSGVWYDYVGGKEYYQDEYFTNSTPPEGAEPFSTHYPTDDMQLFPKFIVTTRTYTVTFYNYNYPEESSVVMQFESEYEQTVSELLTNNDFIAKSKFCYRPDEADFGDTQRYAFKGWMSEFDFNNKTQAPELYILNELKIYSTLNLYAYYEIENAAEVSLNIEYFNITSGGAITPKEEYKELLAGKITLPTKIGDITITSVGADAFKEQKKITEIFFLHDSQCNTIDQYAFADCINLKKIELPDTITHIGPHAFEGAYNLVLNELPLNLQVLNTHAFANTHRANGFIKIQTLPASLTTVGSFAFNNCPNIKITAIHAGIILNNYAFSNCGGAYVDTGFTVRVDIGAGTEEEAKARIGAFAFDGYLGGTNNTTLQYLFPNMSALHITDLGLHNYWGIGVDQVNSQVAS